MTSCSQEHQVVGRDKWRQVQEGGARVCCTLGLAPPHSPVATKEPVEDAAGHIAGQPAPALIATGPGTPTATHCTGRSGAGTRFDAPTPTRHRHERGHEQCHGQDQDCMAVTMLMMTATTTTTTTAVSSYPEPPVLCRSRQLTVVSPTLLGLLSLSLPLLLCRGRFYCSPGRT